MTTELDARLVSILIVLCGILYVLAFDAWQTQVATGCALLVAFVTVYGAVTK